jgi:hypothetical protein
MLCGVSALFSISDHPAVLPSDGRAAKNCGSAAAYVIAVPSGDASQSWESRRSEIGEHHDQFLIHTDHGLPF